MCNLTKEPEDVTVGLVVGEQQKEMCDILTSHLIFVPRSYSRAGSQPHSSDPQSWE